MPAAPRSNTKWPGRAGHGGRWAVVAALLAALLGCATPPDRAPSRSGMADGQGAGSRPGAVPAPPFLPPGAVEARRDAPPEAREKLADVLAAWWPAVVVESEAPPPDALDDPARAREAARRYLKGRDALLNDRTLLAVTELEKARQLDPASPRVARELAHAYAAVGNTGRAIEAYKEVLRLDPDDSEALFSLALAAEGEGDFDTTIHLVARRLRDGAAFDHDAGAPALGYRALQSALEQRGFDQAAVEAGRLALEHIPAAYEQSGYAARLRAFFAERGQVWRSIGDGHLRLHQPADALMAYRAAEALGWRDGLDARVIYANLRLGRAAAAQQRLLEVLERPAADQAPTAEALARYFATQTRLDSASRQAIEARLAAPDGSDSIIVRAAAPLLGRAEATSRLEELVAVDPADEAAVRALLALLASDRAARAIDRAVELTAARPESALACAEALVLALDRVSLAYERLGTPSSWAEALLLARTLQRVRALSEAWQTCMDARRRWPAVVPLQLLEVELAAALDEPSLVRQAERGLEAGDSARAWLIRGRARLETGSLEGALAAGDAALVAGQGDPAVEAEARLLLARTTAEQARVMPVSFEQTQTFARAVGFIEEARALRPTDDAAYLELYELIGPQGSIRNMDRLRLALGELRDRVPGSPLIARLLAQDALQRGRYADALEQGLVLFARDPLSEEALRGAVSAWERLGRAGEAERWLRERLVVQPANLVLLDQLIALYIRQERAEQAVMLLQRRIDRDARDYAVFGLIELALRADERTDEAMGWGERRLLDRPFGTRRALELAALYVRSNRPQLAVEQFNALAAYADGAARGHLTGGISLASSMTGLEPVRHDTMVANLVERSVQARPDLPERMYTIGLRALVRLGFTGRRFDDLVERMATEALRAGDVSVPGAMLWRELAQTLVDIGNPDAARRALRARARLQPALEPDAAGVIAAMTIVADAAAGDDGSASLDLLLGLEGRGLLGQLPGMGEMAAPTLAAALLETSQLYTLLGNETGAERLLEESIRLDPQDGMAQNNLAYLLIEAGRGDARTLGYVEAARARHPEDANVLDTVGWARYKQERFADAADGPGALTLLEQALAASGEDPPAEVLDHYGDALFRLGRAEEAIRAWERAVEQLEDPQRQREVLQSYLLLQSQVWLLVVSDPRAMYHRDFGVILERTRRKLEEVRRGGEPPVAPTFAELTPARDAGPPTAETARGTRNQ